MNARHRTGRAAWLLVALAYGACLLAPVAVQAARASKVAPPAVPTTQLTRMALVADMPQWPTAEADTTALFDQMGTQQVALIIHAGGIKGDTESCADTVLGARQRVLDDSPAPLLYVPGETDWAECHKPVNVKFDAVERLNRLRELFFPVDATLGRRTLPLVRQSDQAMFRSFRENVRLVTGGVMVVGLNLPGDNNHYRSEGGRNGEFEDRREANRQWLGRAFSVAGQRDLPGIVVVVHADPQFGNGWEKKRGKPSLLDGFLRHGTRDGYLEFKRQLRDLTAKYPGQVLLVHASDSGFSVDKPLRDTAGKTVSNFTRVALPIGNPARWVELTVTPGTRSVFQVELQDGPKTN